MRAHWALEPETTYLNHGTVGAPPRCVLEAQQKLREQIERQPSRFLLRELAGIRLGATNDNQPRLRAAAAEVARFLGASSNDLVFVDNATSGINAVLQNFDFHSGDEILVLDQTYGAVRNAAEYTARVNRVKVRVTELPETIVVPGMVVDMIRKAIGPRTRLAIIDHIISENGLIMPLPEISSYCHAQGVAVLVDGAHAPGAIGFEIPSLGADWYCGNLHKWGWAPRSSGILWTSPERQLGLHPPVISWGLDQGMILEFDWPGTRDPTPHLAAPEGLAFMQKLGVREVQRQHHTLAWTAGCEMAARWDSKPLGPEEMVGCMIAVPLPERLGGSTEDAIALRDRLLFEHNIEVHVYARRSRLFVRVSAQVYNEMADVERLMEAIPKA